MSRVSRSASRGVVPGSTRSDAVMRRSLVGAWRRLRRLSRAFWLDPSELRIGLGCMRLSTDEARDEELAARDDRGRRRRRRDGVRHGARVRPRAGRARPQRAAARPCAARDGRRRARADRDQGRDDASGRRLDPGRTREGDPGRLRGEPRGARRTADRPLPDPRARSANAVDDLRARARTARRRRRRATGRRRERQPPSARRGARARADRGGPGRARARSTTARCAEASSSAASSRGSALIAHSPLGGPRRAGSLARQQALVDAAERIGATPPRWRSRGCSSSRPVVVAIPGARRPETARSAARAAALELDDDDRATLAGAFGGARPRSPRVTSRGRRAEVVVVMGIPGRRQEPRRRGVRRARLRPPQPRRARRLAARARGDARRGARVGRATASCSTTRISRGPRGATSSRRPPGTGAGALHLARHAARRRRRSTSSSGCSSGSATLPTPEEVREAREARARRARADVADARAPRARAADATTRASRASSRSPSCAGRPRPPAPASSSPRRR